MSATTLNARGINPSEWRWALHEAECVLLGRNPEEIEKVFVRRLLSLGRQYAVGRYAKWERLPYESALTSTLPFGFRALLDLFLRAAGLSVCSGRGNILPPALKSASYTPGLTAYDRTAIIQTAVHEIAREALGPSGHQKLNRESMRVLLSIARLHFSVAEVGAVSCFNDLMHLDRLYETARRKVAIGLDHVPPVSGRRIKNWEIRHLHPLTHLYPYSIRHAISRALQSSAEPSIGLDRAILVNELALMHGSQRLMRGVSAETARRR